MCNGGSEKGEKADGRITKTSIFSARGKTMGSVKVKKGWTGGKGSYFCGVCVSDGDDGGNEGGNAKLKRKVEEAENKIKLMEQEVREWRKGKEEEKKRKVLWML